MPLCHLPRFTRPVKRYPRSVSDEQLDKTDYDSVYAAMSELEQRGWRKATLNERVAAWEALVVEQGYDMTVDDYTNDLAAREWLELCDRL